MAEGDQASYQHRSGSLDGVGSRADPAASASHRRRGPSGPCGTLSTCYAAWDGPLPLRATVSAHVEDYSRAPRYHPVIEWDVLPALSGLLGVLAGSLITGVVQLRGIRSTVQDNEKAREHAQSVAAEQRKHELDLATSERVAAAEAIESERAERMRQAKRAEVLTTHEEAIAALRGLLAHEESKAGELRFLRGTEPSADQWRDFERSPDRETAAALAVAKVRLICDQSTAQEAIWALDTLRDLRDLTNGTFQSSAESADRQLRDYEGRAAAEALTL